jgi:hypothetical protein
MRRAHRVLKMDEADHVKLLAAREKAQKESVASKAVEAELKGKYRPMFPDQDTRRWSVEFSDDGHVIGFGWLKVTPDDPTDEASDEEE